MDPTSHCPCCILVSEPSLNYKIESGTTKIYKDVLEMELTVWSVETMIDNERETYTTRAHFVTTEQVNLNLPEAVYVLSLFSYIRADIPHRKESVRKVPSGDRPYPPPHHYLNSTKGGERYRLKFS
jgi:hypothetical protein